MHQQKQQTRYTRKPDKGNTQPGRRLPQSIRAQLYKKEAVSGGDSPLRGIFVVVVFCVRGPGHAPGSSPILAPPFHLLVIDCSFSLEPAGYGRYRKEMKQREQQNKFTETQPPHLSWPVANILTLPLTNNKSTWWSG